MNTCTSEINLRFLKQVRLRLPTLRTGQVHNIAQCFENGIHESLESGGEVPTQQEGSFTYDEAKPTPPEYRVHMEWGSPSDAMFGIGRVLFAHPAREIHDKVLDTLIRGPYIRLLNPMMEGTTWREYLNSP
jgi:sulfur oxygenase/reductase